MTVHYVPRNMIGHRLPQTIDDLGTDHQAIPTLDLTDPSNPVIGDCWRTAIASVLGCRRDTVPHFVELAWGNDDYTWWDQTQEWLATQGLTIRHWESLEAARPWGKYLITGGKSPRGDWTHAVVIDADTGNIVHDPHPSGAGLDGPYDGFDAILPLGVEEAVLALGPTPVATP